MRDDRLADLLLALSLCKSRQEDKHTNEAEKKKSQADGVRCCEAFFCSRLIFVFSGIQLGNKDLALPPTLPHFKSFLFSL